METQISNYELYQDWAAPTKLNEMESRKLGPKHQLYSSGRLLWAKARIEIEAITQSKSP